MEDTVKVQAMLNEKGSKPSSFEGSSSVGQFILSELKKKSMLIALIVVVIYFGFSTKGVILLPRNVSNLIFQNAYIAILAVGMLLCILTGGNIDLSVGSSVCLVGAIAGEMMINRKMPVLQSILVCLFLGLVIGIWQGFWIAYVGIPPFIATLAGQLIFRGLSLRVLNGLTLAPFPNSFQNLSTGHIQDYFKIPIVAQRVTFIVLGIIALTVVLFMAKMFRSNFRKIKKFNATVNAIIYYSITAVITAGIVFLTYWLATNKKLTNKFIIPDIKFPEINLPNFRETAVAQIAIFIAVGIIAMALFLTVILRRRFLKIKKGEATPKPVAFYSVTAAIAAVIVFLTYFLATSNGLTKLLKKPEVAQRITFITVGIIAMALFMTIILRRRFLKMKKGETTIKSLVFYPVTAVIAAGIVFLTYFLSTNNGVANLFKAPGAGKITEKTPELPLNITCLVFGIIAAMIFLVLKVLGRVRKIKKGYKTGNAIVFYFSTIVLAAILVFFSLWLARYKGLPTVMVTLIVVVLIYSILTSMTVPGRYLYALGGNPKAARMSGIDTKKVMFFAYANMSFLAGVAGLVFAARLNSANPTAGQNFELDAIASCFIGGASAYGGIGTVGGVLIGAAFMGIMNNGMNFMGFLTADQQIVKGLVLLFAVAFDVISKRKSR